ncbi:hypothetical protein KFK09_024238 [Dendrobium nobile]|uniref:Uncharacterized protein n=1 Tax=Dendrobium nobile TaxID=94219 RepID=A0A8T3ACG6_DENNO|nr:hypothetical protein KFK09_024238 [Dendrobium nobile]
MIEMLMIFFLSWCILIFFYYDKNYFSTYNFSYEGSFWYLELQVFISLGDSLMLKETSRVIKGSQKAVLLTYEKL